jgi:hypothetical protein
MFSRSGLKQAMATLNTLSHRLTGAIAALAFAASVLPAWSDDDGTVQVAAADCYSIGEQVAAQKGGTLAKASASQQGGRTVCVIVVLVPGKDGQRPRREQVVVPAG